MLTIGAGKGGVVNVVWQLAGGMVRRGHDVAVMCDSGTELVRLERLGVKHFPVALHRTHRDLLRARRMLRDAYGAFGPQIVHSHSRWPSIVSGLAGRRVNVSTLHADRLTSGGRVLDRGFVRRLVGGWGRHVTVLSEPIRQMLVRETGLDPSQVTVIPNSADESRFPMPTGPDREAARTRVGVPAGRMVGLFVGSLTRTKRAVWCVRAVKAALDRGVDAGLLVVGEGPELEACESAARELGIGERCRFMGWSDETWGAYAAADVLLLPSEAEGFGLVCVEAMLCGVPVLRTACGGSEQQIIEGVTGWATDPADESAFVERFIAAASDRKVIDRMRDAARSHALAHFTEEAFLDRFEALYRVASSKRVEP